MNAKVWLIAACILFLGIAAYVYWQTSNAPAYTPPVAEPAGEGVVGNTKSDTDPYDVLITYSDDGFTPRDITISQGTRVRFLNNSNESIWPASGVHPTHTLYPEKESSDCLGSSFDSCKALEKGKFFDFTFYYIGVWSFHDHLHAYHTGAITVTATAAQ